MMQRMPISFRRVMAGFDSGRMMSASAIAPSS
jgi:hypothetical protein